MVNTNVNKRIKTSAFQIYNPSLHNILTMIRKFFSHAFSWDNQVKNDCPHFSIVEIFYEWPRIVLGVVAELRLKPLSPDSLATEVLMDRLSTF